MEQKHRQEPPATFSQAWNQGVQIGLELNEAKAAMRETIAHRIKTLRLSAKMTQEDLAKEININYLTYRGYENCRSDIPIVYLIRVADVMGVSLDYLTGRTENRTGGDGNIQERLEQLEKAMAKLNKESK